MSRKLKREEVLKEGKYLPKFLRSFDTQKAVFRTIAEDFEKIRETTDDWHLHGLTWTNTHVYTVDFFLWYMARHGYSLQKDSRIVDPLPLDDLTAIQKRLV